MKCRACGTENGSNVTYCKNCGARLTGVGSVNDFDMFDEDSDIIDDTGVFDDASISDLEKRFMNGVESWEATTDVGKKPGAAQPRASANAVLPMKTTSPVRSRRKVREANSVPITLRSKPPGSEHRILRAHSGRRGQAAVREPTMKLAELSQ